MAVISRQIPAGIAARVCPGIGIREAHCLAWMRTDEIASQALGPIGYAPSDLQSAYSLTAASSADGGGQDIAIVDAYDDPHAEADLAVYRTAFALPACTVANGCFQKVNESGMTSPLPGTDPTGGWEAEESLDLDMVSAICPNCNIILVEGATANTNDLYTAEDTAAATCGANVISNSWSTTEYSSEHLDEVHFNHPGIMITVAAGDNGYGPLNTGYPSTSQYVTSVGGTSLHHVGAVWSETVWSNSGSVCSAYIAQPAWQTALGVGYTSICAKRIDNDVAAEADPNTGVAVYDSFGGASGCPSWCQFGGTSASTPIIGAVYALAGNEGSLTYGSYPYSHTGSLTDITSGSNGACGNFLCTGGVGFDGPTGNGAF